MTKGPPPRLLDDPAAPQALREDLAQAKRAETPYDTATGFASLATALEADSAVASQSAEGAVASGTKAGAGAKLAGGVPLAVKLAAGVTGVALATTLATTLMLGGDATPDRQAPPAAPAPTDRATAGPPQEAATPPGVPATSPSTKTGPSNQQPRAAKPEPTSNAHNGHGAVRIRRQKRPVHADETPRGARSPETANLARVKRLLEARPGAALRAAEAGHRRFGHGMFYPEREALAILALAALDRGSEAATRGRRFLAQHPDHPMRKRVRTVLQEAGAAEDEEPR